MKKLLITGAFGLVGSNICKILEAHYPDIEVTKVKFDKLPNDSYKKYDYVIYGAGYGQPMKFMEDKIETVRIHSGQPLIESIISLNSGGKFLYISSSEIYSGAPSPHKETYIGTTTPQHPRACYIEGKRCGEAICMAYREQGYDVKIARLALAYGPGTKKGDTRVINQFIEQALTKGSIWLRDKGEAMRTYVYVEDAAQMMLDVLFKGKEVVYNIGGESRVSILNLAQTIGAITQSKVYCGEVSLDGAPDDVKLCLNRINAEFPREFVSLEEGLIKTIEYQKQLYGTKD